MIDAVRFVMAILVVAIHVRPFEDIDRYMNLIVSDVIARIAVPFFFTCTGFFMAKRILSSSRRDFYQAVKNLIFSYLVWVAIYLPIQWMLYYRGTSLTISDALSYLGKIVYHEPHYHLWYMNAMILALLIVFVLRMIFSSGKIFMGALVLYVIGSVGDVYIYLLKEDSFIRNVYESYFDIFHTTRNGLFFGLVFVAMGLYIRENHKNLIAAKYTFVISLFLLFMEPMFLYATDSFRNVNMYIFLVPVTFYLFLLVSRSGISISDKSAEFFRKTASMIYFIHPLMDFLFLQTFYCVTGRQFSGSLQRYAVVLCLSILISSILIHLKKYLSNKGFF